MDDEIKCEHNPTSSVGSEGSPSSAVPENKTIYSSNHAAVTESKAFFMVDSVKCATCGTCIREADDAKKIDEEPRKSPPQTAPSKGKSPTSRVLNTTGAPAAAAATKNSNTNNQDNSRKSFSKTKKIKGTEKFPGNMDANDETNKRHDASLKIKDKPIENSQNYNSIKPTTNSQDDCCLCEVKEVKPTENSHDDEPSKNSQGDLCMCEMEAMERRAAQSTQPDVSHCIMFCTRTRGFESHSMKCECGSGTRVEVGQGNSQAKDWHKSKAQSQESFSGLNRHTSWPTNQGNGAAKIVKQPSRVSTQSGTEIVHNAPLGRNLADKSGKTKKLERDPPLSSSSSAGLLVVRKSPSTVAKQSKTSKTFKQICPKCKGPTGELCTRHTHSRKCHECLPSAQICDGPPEPVNVPENTNSQVHSRRGSPIFDENQCPNERPAKSKCRKKSEIKTCCLCAGLEAKRQGASNCRGDREAHNSSRANESHNSRGESKMQNCKRGREAHNSRRASETHHSRRASEILHSRRASETRNSRRASETHHSRRASEVLHSRRASETRNSRRASETHHSRRASESHRSRKTNEARGTHRYRSVSDSSSPHKYESRTTETCVCTSSPKNSRRNNNYSERHREKYGRNSSTSSSDLMVRQNACRDYKCKRKCRECADASTMTPRETHSRRGSKLMGGSRSSSPANICGICPKAKTCDHKCSLSTQTSRLLMDFQNANIKATQTKRTNRVRSLRRKPGTQYTCCCCAPQIQTFKRDRTPQIDRCHRLAATQSSSSEFIRAPQSRSTGAFPSLHQFRSADALSRDKMVYTDSGNESDLGVIIDHMQKAVIVCACDSSNLDRTLRELLPKEVGCPTRMKCRKRKRPKCDRFASPPFVLNPMPRSQPHDYVNTCCYPVDKRSYSVGCGGCCW
ncbi:blast:Accumulation-associated protein [Drosophila guanche]|uniref:Blast:Accumulation-associated protein n=1 Tax=Drosophila guanche TaxID=7266 RepID=A0A3B0JV91_DROGU|nr:blast:Accumulation-associated protein [Drosophila guanche]